MLDRYLLAATKPLVDAAARALHARNITANQISFVGFGFGLLAAFLIVTGQYAIAILPLLINRLCDGLDGAVARHTTPTDRGAFLDITLDFLLYAAVPLAFAINNPDANAFAAAVLLASFIGTGTSFLAFAVLSAKRGEKSDAYPSKGFYYLGGLTEGFETVACFVAMCLWPAHFAVIAYVYAALCAITTLTRIVAGWQHFGH